MKFLAFLIIILISAQDGLSQNHAKIDLSVGYGGSYFFDSYGFKVTDIYSSPWPTFSLTRNFGSTKFLSFSYGSYSFIYTKDRQVQDWSGYFPGQLLYRNFSRFSVNGGVINQGNYVCVKGQAGLAIIVDGSKSTLLAAFNHGGWIEPHFNDESYNSVGGTLGLAVRHVILKRLFGELRTEFTQMVSGVDRSQLMAFYQIGYSF